MRQLVSKNYQGITVTLRNEDRPIQMAVAQGLKLMQYLTGGDATNHIQITDVDGNVIVVRTTDILKVEPVLKMKGVKGYV